MRLALSGDLIRHIERLVAFYGLSLAGFALLFAALSSSPVAVVATGAVFHTGRMMRWSERR